MNILKRKELNTIEGIGMNNLKRVLNGREVNGVSVDSVIFNKILLTDGTVINCIKEYYKNVDETVPKNSNKISCPVMHRFYNLRCTPYDCERCHLQMISKREDRKVKRKIF